jgi:hypothetical protein
LVSAGVSVAQDKQDNITSSACQDEVFYYELMEVTDFRNDVILAEACRNDVEAYCKDVEPGAQQWWSAYSTFLGDEMHGIHGIHGMRSISSEPWYAW